MTTDPSPSKPGLRERKKRDVQHTIRTAALRLFLQHGYAAVSVEQIAAAANVARTTFFNYFPSKEAVLTDPDPDLVERWRQRWTSRPPGEQPWTSLTAMLVQCTRDLSDWLLAVKQLKSADAGAAPNLYGGNDPLTRPLRTWVVDEASEQRRAAARLQFAVANAALSTAFEEWDAAEPIEELVELVQRYLDQLAPAFAA
ncbi:hypothetical protein Cs7R123_44160 [Catellatospora sp. TT07R-123]|uniref:TetR/AcrR family transcriptional regulator n=1 Tax=Catellatospora sp. TT07R-123 TaxID=2733863 RepID=UPI001B25B0FA|nr:TetR/AcrR family transcriptional regulator [Catellatospora sp. TT07R-123]GHJ47074.1 hypothetical protein Cs7R123_44160 [Catellatospora sp. TT07R-123]